MSIITMRWWVGHWQTGETEFSALVERNYSSCYMIYSFIIINITIKKFLIPSQYLIFFKSLHSLKMCNLSLQKNVKSKNINIYPQLATTAKISVRRLSKDIFVICIFVVHQIYMAARCVSKVNQINLAQNYKLWFLATNGLYKDGFCCADVSGELRADDCTRSISRTSRFKLGWWVYAFFTIN